MPRYSGESGERLVVVLGRSAWQERLAEVLGGFQFRRLCYQDRTTKYE